MNYCFVFGHEPWLLPPALEMIDVIRKNGNSVDVVYAEYTGNGVPAGDYDSVITFSIVEKGTRRKHYFKHLYLRQSVRKLLKTKKVDVIIACDLISLQALVAIGGNAKKGYWCFERYYSSVKVFSMDYFRNRQEKPWIEKMDFLLMPSESRKKAIISDYKLSLPTGVIYNCKQLRAGGNKVTATAYTQHSKLLIYAGRISPTQYIDEMIDAMELLDGRFGFLLVGPGDEGYINSLKQRVAVSKTLSEKVHFLGRVSREEVYGLIDMADIGFVFYKEITPGVISDPAPNKIGDYIAGKTWMIGTDQKYIYHWLEEKGAGICLGEVTGESIAAAVNKIAVDKSFSETSVLAQLYQQELNMDIQYHKLTKLIDSL